MNISVQFKKDSQSLKVRFEEVHEISDGGYEIGYSKGYNDGEEVGREVGYKEGYTVGFEVFKENEIFYNEYGTCYLRNMEMLNMVTNTTMNSKYIKCVNIESVTMDGEEISLVAGVTYLFSECFNLRKAIIKNVTIWGHYCFRNCQKLQEVQLGCIGVPVSKLTSLTFYNCPQLDLTITVYVDATTLGNIPTDIASDAPWGATNATIIYRNSTTGEVIEA